MDTLPPNTGDGKENFNLEEFIGSLPVKSAPFEKRFVSDAILEGLISGDCIMSTTRNMYPPLAALTEPSFIPYPPLPYTPLPVIPCCIPCCNPVDSWHSGLYSGLYPTTCNPLLPILQHKEVAAPFIRPPKRPLESKITWSAAYNMDYNYNPPAMTMAGSRPYSQPRTFGYPRAANFSTVAPDILPRVVPDCDIAPPRLSGLAPPKTRAGEYLIQKPRPAHAMATIPLTAAAMATIPLTAAHHAMAANPLTTLAAHPLAAHSLTANPLTTLAAHPLAAHSLAAHPLAAHPVLPSPILPPPTLPNTVDIKKKPVTYRFVYPKKEKKYIRVKSKKLHKCRKAPTRAQKLVLSLTKPLLDCYRKGLDTISRKIPIDTDSNSKSSCSNGPSSPKEVPLDPGYDLLAVAMLTKCLHFEQSNVNPLHPLKRYVVENNASGKRSRESEPQSASMF